MARSMTLQEPCATCGETTPLMHGRWIGGYGGPVMRWTCDTCYAAEQLRRRLQLPLPVGAGCRRSSSSRSRRKGAAP